MYFVRKNTYYFSLLLGIILFSFLLFHIIPTDPARIILGPNADEQQVNSLRKELGLDKPLIIQFISYLRQIAGFDFGKSFVDGRLVYDEIVDKLGVSLFMICCCLFITIFYSFLSILFPLSNRLFKVLNFLFISTPSFFSGLIVALIAVRYLPFFSFSGSFESVSDYIFFLPPAFVLSLYPMAILSKILANEMEEILKKPYILAARAYAFNEKKICYIYALKNAVIPYLAAISNQLPMLFTGAFIVEIIFSVPGIGSLLIKSVLERDFPMLEAIIILNGIIFILTNIFFENLYPLIDPRIRKK